MTDHFDEGREGLEGASPTRDLWAEAQGRATHSTVPLTTVPEARHRHPGRWLAAAAAVALVVGVGLAIVSNDDDPVQVGNDGTTGITSPPPTYGQGTPCPFTIKGDQVQLHTGHVPGERFDVQGAPEGGPTTVMNGYLGDQQMEVSIPGQVVTDLVGERVEDIELQRGTAQLWLSDGFAQVRWFPGTEGCTSFTVTVFGPNEDFNRHAAVDFADRLVLPTEAVSTQHLVGTWHLVEVTTDGTTTAANGEEFTFGADHSVTYTDGCNGSSGTYADIPGGSLIELHDQLSTLVGCPETAVRTAIQQVLGGSQQIAWKNSGDQLVLHTDGGTLVFDPAGSSDSTTTSTQATTTTTTEPVTSATDQAPTGWPVEGAWDLYSLQSSGSSDPTVFPANLEVIFGGTSIKWEDGCNEHLGTVQRIDGHTFVVQDPRVESPKPCPSTPESTMLENVLGSGAQLDASLEGAAGSIYLTITAPSGDQVVLRRQNMGSSPSGQAPFG